MLLDNCSRLGRLLGIHPEALLKDLSHPRIDPQDQPRDCLGLTADCEAALFERPHSDRACADALIVHVDLMLLGVLSTGRVTRYKHSKARVDRAIARGTVETISAKARAAGLANMVSVAGHDMREPLPLPNDSIDASYSHMLFCMALTTTELEHLVLELRRVLRPGGMVVYTARTTADAHFGAGTPRGDDMYEHGGFIVHFFDRALIDRLAAGFELIDVTEFSEGELPRRLARVTMRVPQR